MISPAAYSLFLLTSLVLLLTPGPAVLYILTRSIHQGRNAGIVSAAGLGLGNLVQAAAATAGLSLVLTSSAVLFNLVKSLGALYLVYLGVRTIRTRIKPGPSPEAKQVPLGRVFREGLIINMFNPKVALFFLAYLPQFAAPAGEGGPGQIFLLGASFAALGIVTDSLYALLSSSASTVLRRSPAFARIERTAAALIYISLGIGALLYQNGNAN